MRPQSLQACFESVLRYSMHRIVQGDFEDTGCADKTSSELFIFPRI